MPRGDLFYNYHKLLLRNMCQEKKRCYCRAVHSLTELFRIERICCTFVAHMEHSHENLETT